MPAVEESRYYGSRRRGQKKSSEWVKGIHPACEGFYWQNGYAAFGVGQRDIPTVKNYIRDQRTHNGSRSFQTERRNLLGEHGLSWDEGYVWD
jgi:hypothetical protein